MKLTTKVTPIGRQRYTTRTRITGAFQSFHILTQAFTCMSHKFHEMTIIESFLLIIQ